MTVRIEGADLLFHRAIQATDRPGGRASNLDREPASVAIARERLAFAEELRAWLFDGGAA